MLRRRLTIWGTLAACLFAGPASAQQVTMGFPQEAFVGQYQGFYGGGPWCGVGAGFCNPWGIAPWLAMNPAWLMPPAFIAPNSTASYSSGHLLGTGAPAGPFVYSTGAAQASIYTATTPYLTGTAGVPGFFYAGPAVPNVPGGPPMFAPGVPGLDPAFSNLGAANSLDGRFQRGEFHMANGRVIAGPDPALTLPPELAAPPALFSPPEPDPAAGLRAELDALAAQRAAAQLQARVVEAQEREREIAPSQARELFEKAQRLEAEGKLGAACLLYQTALRKAEGDLRQQIEQRLEAMGR